MIDIHTHILPGVDDGAKNMQMTAQMLEQAADIGVQAIVCTPHVYHPEHQHRIKKGWTMVERAARQHGIQVFSGCEFNYHALSETGTDNLDAFCLASTPCILLELSNEHLFRGWEAMICEMVDHGYSPIIAHPERYTYIQKDIEIANAMCDFGCELQVDAGGLLARVFSAERRTARKLLSQGMVSYIASDAHKPRHYETYEKAYRAFGDELPRRNKLVRYLRRQAK